MKKKNLFSLALIGTLTLSTLQTPLSISATEINEVHNSGTNNKVVETKLLTNQQLFDELEKQGFELTDIFTEEEINTYKAQDKLRAGNTTLNIHEDGSATLYLSSAYTKTISGLGVGAGNIIGGLIGTLGGPASMFAGTGLGGYLGQIAISDLDTTKGIYIKFDRPEIKLMDLSLHQVHGDTNNMLV